MPSHPFATRETRLEYFDGSSWMSCLAVLERSKLIFYREGDSSEDAKDESKIVSITCIHEKVFLQLHEADK